MEATTHLAIAPDSYAGHIQLLCERYQAALRHCQLDAVVIAAGKELPVFLDDQHYRFKPNPHFVQWVPLTDQPNAWVIYRPGDKPQLVILQPADFWHATPELPDDSYLSHFDVQVFTDAKLARQAVDDVPGSVAAIDPDKGTSDALQPLLNFLHYHRAVKSAYEVECMAAATATALPGHQAAKQAFENGGSEFDIHCAFMQAVGCSEHELPYPDIVACNEHAAVLHYQKRTHATDPQSLLIDAGTAVNGYSSDITRTYAAGDNAFSALISGLDKVQQHLCTLVRPGISFGDLHHEAHTEIAGLLIDHDILNGKPEKLIKEHITSAFFPHGLGHFLGIQVHDLGGHMADVEGTQAPPPADYPHLRMTRSLEPGMALTIEPGIYFIDMLLQDFAGNKAINWQKVDELRPYGGIRIEDNLVVTESGATNLTRAAS